VRDVDGPLLVALGCTGTAGEPEVGAVAADLAGLEGKQPSRSAPDRVRGASWQPIHHHCASFNLDPQPDLTRLVEPGAQPCRPLVPERLVREHVVHDDLTVRQRRKAEYVREVSARVGVGGAPTPGAPPNPSPLNHDHPRRMPVQATRARAIRAASRRLSLNRERGHPTASVRTARIPGHGQEQVNLPIP